MCGSVSTNGHLSSPFIILNGTCEWNGCILAPLLFILFYAAVVWEAMSKTTAGVYNTSTSELMANYLTFVAFMPRLASQNCWYTSFVCRQLCTFCSHWKSSSTKLWWTTLQLQLQLLGPDKCQKDRSHAPGAISRQVAYSVFNTNITLNGAKLGKHSVWRYSCGQWINCNVVRLYDRVWNQRGLHSSTKSTELSFCQLFSTAAKHGFSTWDMSDC